MRIKHIAAALSIVLMTSACNADTPAAPAPEPAKPTAPAPVETKKLCIKVFDAKQNKEVEKCRTLKTHQKHDGTKVPEKK